MWHYALQRSGHLGVLKLKNTNRSKKNVRCEPKLKKSAPDEHYALREIKLLTANVDKLCELSDQELKSYFA